MNITRHNYEEFFILYLDNELSSDDRRHVERFVHDNPDLKNEFELLLQTRMMPEDHLVFDGKPQLLKTASPAPINETNFEEWLLLYIDNELTAQENIAVEEFIAGHPSAKAVLQQFQKAKFHPEQSIVFSNREILYRRARRASVIAFHWRKIAVAASLLLAISTAAFFIFSNRNSNEEKIISQQDFGKNATKDDSADNASHDPAVAGPVISKNDDGKEEVDPLNNLLADQKKNPVDENEKNKQQNIAAKQDSKLIAENNIAVEPSNKLPGTDQNANVAKGSEENPIAMVDLPKKEALTSNSDNKPIEVVTPDNTLSLDEAKTAVTIEPGYDLVTDESGKKNKLRGFFRKVTRTFEKRTNIKATDDEDRLLLAGLSIKL